MTEPNNNDLPSVSDLTERDEAENFDPNEYDLEENLRTYPVTKTELNKYINQRLKKHPALKLSLWEAFVRAIAVEKFSSILTNTSDTTAYRRMTTIRAEGDSLAYCLNVFGVNLPEWIDRTAPADVVATLENQPGREPGSTAAPSSTLGRVKVLGLVLDIHDRAFRAKLGIRSVRRGGGELAREYKYNIDRLKILVDMATVARREEQAAGLPDNWIEVLRLVGEKFGVESKEFLIFSLYHVFPLRDDFGDILIQSPGFQDAHKDSNYLILKDEGPLSLYIWRHKTRNLYGDLGGVIPLRLSNMIRHFINERHLGVGDYLFGAGKKLSHFIKKTFEAIGFPNLSINSIRQIYEKETQQSNTLLERIKRSYQAGHSYQTALNTYVAPSNRSPTSEENSFNTPLVPPPPPLTSSPPEPAVVSPERRSTPFQPQALRDINHRLEVIEGRVTELYQIVQDSASILDHRLSVLKSRLELIPGAPPAPRGGAIARMIYDE